MLQQDTLFFHKIIKYASTYLGFESFILLKEILSLSGQPINIIKIRLLYHTVHSFFQLNFNLNQPKILKDSC